MERMESKIDLLEPLIERAENYAKSSFELYKLRTVHKSATIISTVYLRGIVIFLFSIFFITASIGVSLWLGDVLGKSYYGFFCVAGFYAISGMIVSIFMGNSIKNRVTNSVITKILN